MLVRSPTPIRLRFKRIIPGCRPRIKRTDWERDRATAKIRKQRERARKRKKSLLSLTINRAWLIDTAVERGLLTERDVEDPGKLQAALNMLQTEIEGVVADKIRSWRRQK
jgi:hypothetical protein